mgnify:CR=1 FL=1|tara:strand:- start:6055 stop:6747 length:693 start_codon:yes stop_codon:yes gene_type:complete
MQNNFLTQFDEIMLSSKTISKIPIFENQVKQKITTTTEKKKFVKKREDIFCLKENDQLFWYFFIFFYGMEEYETISNYFLKEKEVKFNFVEKIRNNKQLCKQLKISRNVVEDELVNQKKISLKSLKLLCYLFDINVFYIENKKYYEMIPNENNKIFVIEKIEKDNVIKYVSKESIEYYRLHYWKMENLDKPLKAVSSYKVDELKSICKKLSIPFDKETKQELYQKILTII